MLAAGEQIGYVLHEGAFAVLGRPGDFLGASLEALARGGPFLSGAGFFDEAGKVLSRVPVANLEVRGSVIGDARIGPSARIVDSAVWDGVEIGAGAQIERCLAAGGRIPPGVRHADSLLWPGRDGAAAAYRLDPP